MSKIEQLEMDLDRIRSGSWKHNLSAKQRAEGIGLQVFRYCVRDILGTEEKWVSTEVYEHLAKSISKSEIFKGTGQPQYHNYVHACEAMVSAAYLIKEELAEDKDKLGRFGPLLVLTMMVHDLGHTGKPAKSFQELEMMSFDEAEKVMSNALVDAAEIQSGLSKRALSLTESPLFVENMYRDMKSIILGTEFSKMAGENKKVYQEWVKQANRAGYVSMERVEVDGEEIAIPKFDRDYRLTRVMEVACEADVLASSLPQGYRLGKKLAEEIGVAAIGEWSSRLGFLRNMVDFTSKGAKELGIQSYVDAQASVIEENIDKLREVAKTSGAYSAGQVVEKETKVKLGMK